MFGNHGLCGLLEEGAHGKFPKCLDGNLGDFGEFCKGLVLVNSQGATVATLFPIGISLGIPAPIIIGTFVAVNGYFFIPNYGPIIAAIDFDSTGSTKIGKFIFNHSFMIPGLLSMAFSLAFGLLLANYFF